MCIYTGKATIYQENSLFPPANVIPCVGQGLEFLAAVFGVGIPVEDT